GRREMAGANRPAMGDIIVGGAYAPAAIISSVLRCFGYWLRAGGLGGLSVRLPTPRCRGVWAASLRPVPKSGDGAFGSVVALLPLCGMRARRAGAHGRAWLVRYPTLIGSQAHPP